MAEDTETDADLTEIVTEEVTDQLDAGDLLDGGSIEEQIDASELGVVVGGRFGAKIGRRMGEEIGGNIHESLADAVDRGADLTDVVGEVKGAVRDGLRETVSGMEGRDTLVTALQGIGDEGGIGDRVSEAISTDSDDELGVTERVDEATPDVRESDEGEEDEGEEDEGEEDADEAQTGDEDEADTEGDLEAADLEGVRRETLEDLLEVMSYRDLQSIAKDVGVKANLSREEMTDEIVETVASDERSEDEMETEAEAE